MLSGMKHERYNGVKVRAVDHKNDNLVQVVAEDETFRSSSFCVSKSNVVPIESSSSESEFGSSSSEFLPDEDDADDSESSSSERSV